MTWRRSRRMRFPVQLRTAYAAVTTNHPNGYRSKTNMSGNGNDEEPHPSPLLRRGATFPNRGRLTRSSLPVELIQEYGPHYIPRTALRKGGRQPVAFPVLDLSWGGRRRRTGCPMTLDVAAKPTDKVPTLSRARRAVARIAFPVWGRWRRSRRMRFPVRLGTAYAADTTNLSNGYRSKNRHVREWERRRTLSVSAPASRSHRPGLPPAFR